MLMNGDNNIEFSISFPEIEYVDYYKEARDSFLRKTFHGYPELKIESFEFLFSISSSAKNGPLIYAVLDTIPTEYYFAEKNDIRIKISTEEELITQLDHISDLLVISKSWKSTKIIVNGIEIGVTTEYGYLIDFLFEKNNLKSRYFRKTTDEIKKKYSTRKKAPKKREKLQPITISKNDVAEALRLVIDKYIELYGHNKEIKLFEVSSHDKVIAVEDDLIVDFRLIPWYWTRADDENFKEWEYPYIMIQEMTHNELFKFNFADFRRRFQYDSIGIDFYPYHGLHYYRAEIDNFDTVDKKLPELRLQERYQKYPGETHHFIILRMEHNNGKVVYGVGDTKGKVHSFVLKLCKELEEKNSRTLELNGASCLPFSENRQFVEAFLSWKGKKKRWRLENKFSYYYEDRQVKNDLDLFSIPSEIIDAANKGAYNECEFGSYNKPVNRWKSEELVYNIARKLYKDYQVIYQYKPFYLGTEKGNMSYDIYICGLKIAIEYQGKQHFEPVDYFGGAENFEKQKERDELKAKRSEENGVKLIYVNYWEDITPDLVKQKVDSVLGK